MRCIVKIISAIAKGYILRLVQAMARITGNPPESRTLKQAPCQDLLFAYKSIYTEINSGILIRGLDPSLSVDSYMPCCKAMALTLKFELYPSPSLLYKFSLVQMRIKLGRALGKA